MVNFVTALAYHFCLALPTAFTQPGAHLSAEPCTCAPDMDEGCNFKLIQLFEIQTPISTYSIRYAMVALIVSEAGRTSAGRCARAGGARKACGARRTTYASRCLTGTSAMVRTGNNYKLWNLDEFMSICFQTLLAAFYSVFE